MKPILSRWRGWEACACALLALAASSYPFAASAFKPKTHVHLAEEAVADALDDGRVTIYATDYWNGTRLQPIGHYSVDNRVLNALRNHMSHYRAGVVGPDGYPDLHTGQTLIHPETNAYGGADAWLDLIWNSALDSNDPRAIAFAAGFLAHGAGDAFGHTLVNKFTGHVAFTLNPPSNAATHMIVENYIGSKTPAIPSYATSIQGIENFIYTTMLDARRSPGGTEQNRPWQLMARLRQESVAPLPVLLTKWRALLNDDIEAYYDKVRWYKKKIRNASNWFKEMGYRADLAWYRLTRGTIIAYMEAWVQDMNRALKEWVRLGHKLSQLLVFNSSGSMNLDAAGEHAEDYWWDYLLPALGVPDVIADIFGMYDTIQDALEDLLDIDFEIYDPFEAYAERVLEEVVKNYTGKTLQEWKNTMQQLPEAAVRAELDDALRLGSSGVYNAVTFAAAHNTVTMIKLSFLSTSELRRLLRDLGLMEAWVERVDRNAMLGWLASMDHHREMYSNDKLMPLALDCYLYTKVFMRQVGEEQHDGHNNTFRYDKLRKGPNGTTSVERQRVCAKLDDLFIPDYAEGGICGDQLRLRLVLDREEYDVPRSVDVEVRIDGQLTLPKAATAYGSTITIDLPRIGSGNHWVEITGRRFDTVTWKGWVSITAPHLQAIVTADRAVNGTRLMGEVFFGCNYPVDQPLVISSDFFPNLVVPPSVTNGIRSGGSYPFEVEAPACMPEAKGYVYATYNGSRVSTDRPVEFLESRIASFELNRYDYAPGETYEATVELCRKTEGEAVVFIDWDTGWDMSRIQPDIGPPPRSTLVFPSGTDKATFTFKFAQHPLWKDFGDWIELSAIAANDPPDRKHGPIRLSTPRMNPYWRCVELLGYFGCNLLTYERLYWEPPWLARLRVLWGDDYVNARILPEIVGNPAIWQVRERMMSLYPEIEAGYGYEYELDLDYEREFQFEAGW